MSSDLQQVGSCDGLRAGMAIEARTPLGAVFEGTVEEVAPDLRLFWAVSPSGVRRIIEFDEYEVCRA